MPATRCMYDVVEVCKNSSCKFIHRRDEDDWDTAPVMDRRTARLLIQKASANKGLRSLSSERNARRDPSRSRQPSPSNSAPEKTTARESGEEKEGKTSSSSSSKHLVAKDSPDFKTDCLTVIGLISTLSRGGNSADAIEKIKKIYAVLGKKMPE